MILRTATILLLSLAGALAAPPPASQPAASQGEDDPSTLAQKLIYFPPHLFKDIRDVPGQHYILWTNVSQPDSDAIRQHLDQVVRYLDSLPLQPALATTQPASAASSATSASLGPATNPAPPRSTVAALYAQQDQFKALWVRVGVYYAGRFFGLSQAGGYSYRVFCATYMDQAIPQAIPPELCHEFAHVWIWQRTGLPNDGNWLSEGLGSAVQLKFFPASADRADWVSRVDSRRYIPLRRLMSGQPIPADQYWQATSLAEMLLARHADALPAVIQALAEGRSGSYLVTTALGTDWLTFEKQWIAYVRDAGKP